MNRRAASDIDRINLSHGQVRWVLGYAFDLGEYSDATLDSYLNFLRRNGMPFAKGETPGGPGVNVAYHYEHVMELAVAPALRRQAVLRKDTVALLVQLRVAEWHQIIAEPTFADAILDRIVHNAHRIALDGPSMRQLKADKLGPDGIDQTEGN